MCLIETGVVVATREDAAIVLAEGRERLVANLLVPDVEVGDVVVLGLGTLLGRATADEAADLRALRSAAIHPAGPPPEPVAG